MKSYSKLKKSDLIELVRSLEGAPELSEEMRLENLGLTEEVRQKLLCIEELTDRITDLELELASVKISKEALEEIELTEYRQNRLLTVVTSFEVLIIVILMILTII